MTSRRPLSGRQGEKGNKPGGHSVPSGLYWTLLAALLLASTAALVFAYTHEQDDVNGPVAARWCSNHALPCSDAVTWSLNPNAPNVNTTGGLTLRLSIQAAFASWAQASLKGQVITGISFAEGGDSTLPSPDANDCINVIGFTDPTKSDFSTGTIAFTAIATAFGAPPTQYSCSSTGSNFICPLPSCIVDADIQFNPSDTFSTASATPANDFDLQTIATHEIGHLLGMDHSGLANAIMFAFGDEGTVPTRNLSEDDILAVGSVYPSASFQSAVGKLSGTVTLNGSGIFAAHVVVTDANTGLAVTDGLTNSDGTYSIFAPPGSYQV
ncbi:MAG: matrixin family metalloprotease, partial [Terriglobia bacterium]